MFLRCCFAWLCVCTALFAAPLPETIVVEGGSTDLTNVPVTLAMPGVTPGSFVTLQPAEGKPIVGQIVGTGPSLVFVVPELAKKAKLTYTLKPVEAVAGALFSWDEMGQTLSLGKRPVLRIMNAPLDETSKESRFQTYKVYHHLFDPAGKSIVTNGPEGKFPHHRGLFFGFNRVSYGKKTADVWHCNKGEFQSFDKLISSEAGPVVGGHTVAIGWHGQDKAVFANETRELEAYHVTGGTMLDFRTHLESAIDEPIKLDGDPQHAGFHFRASSKVETEAAQQTYYLRPDGKGEMGKTRNWDAKGKDAKTINLPWNAMSFVLGGQRYTLLRINHPGNPTDTRGSERDYGRFGDYFEYTLTKEKPLNLQYRVWLQEGEMTVEQCNAMADAFVHPPKAVVGEK